MSAHAHLDQKEAAGARPQCLRALKRGTGKAQGSGSAVFGVQKSGGRSHSPNGRKGFTKNNTCRMPFLSLFLCSRVQFNL